MLLLAAMIWGAAFVAQRVGMDHLGPLSFNGIRNLLGGAALAPLALFRQRRKPGPVGADSSGTGRVLLLGGLFCGVVLALASSLQQIGLMSTSVSKASFISTLYVVLVPLLGLLLGRRPTPVIWVCVGLSLVGLYLLCITGSLGFDGGDLLELGAALGYAVQILVLAHYSPRVDPVGLSCLQFLTCGVVCLVPALIWEHPTVSDALGAWVPLLYAGLISTGIGYTLQTVAQRRTEPSVASLIMCLESVFGAVFGVALLGEALSLREWAGCVLMLGAVLLANVPRRHHAGGPNGRNGNRECAQNLKKAARDRNTSTKNHTEKHKYSTNTKKHGGTYTPAVTNT